MDLDEPADVYWTEEMSPNVVRGAEKKKSCETIAEAVRFVMETLPEPLRAGAYIGADKDLDLRGNPGDLRQRRIRRLQRLSLTHPRFVIPAQAGMPESHPRLIRVPAFAGMTGRA